MDCHRIYTVARDIKAKYNTSDPFELCRCMGVHVRYGDLGSLKGLYKYIKKNYEDWVTTEEHPLLSHEIFKTKTSFLISKN